MVYYGPSRACNSCRQRRKKCDETRPSCLRCVKAGRTCGGWEHANSLPVRHHKQRRVSPVPSFKSTARKCGLPKRVPDPATGILPEDKLPSETSRAESKALALRNFFYDFCSVSLNPDWSSGYLAKLEPFALQLGESSELVKACQAISFGGHGKPLNRPRLVEQAEMLHQESLSAFAAAMQALPDPSSSKDHRMIAMLLGIYEIFMCSAGNLGNHVAHARGLSALMGIHNDPLAYATKSFEIFSLPPFEGLTDLLSDYRTWRTRLDTTTNMADLDSIRLDGIALHKRLRTWAASRPPEVQPIPICRVNDFNEDNVPVGYCPVEITTYFDLHVAGMWNVYRAIRLKLLHSLYYICQTSSFYLSAYGDIYLKSANEMAEEILASVPYHLVDDLSGFAANLDRREPIKEPGKALGALLLMHPLQNVTEALFVGTRVRKYARDTLLWISEHMGIGLAEVLALRTDFDREYLESALVIIWSGFTM